MQTAAARCLILRDRRKDKGANTQRFHHQPPPNCRHPACGVLGPDPETKIQVDRDWCLKNRCEAESANGLLPCFLQRFQRRLGNVGAQRDAHPRCCGGWKSWRYQCPTSQLSRVSQGMMVARVSTTSSVMAESILLLSTHGALSPPFLPMNRIGDFEVILTFTPVIRAPPPHGRPVTMATVVHQSGNPSSTNTPSRINIFHTDDVRGLISQTWLLGIMVG